MIYRFSIKTPKNTPEKNKIKTDLKLTAGVIHQVDIQFPPGPEALLHVQIHHGLYQVWPSNPEESFASDAVTITFREFYDFTETPYVLSVYTWNEDDTYDHEVIIRLGILPKEALDPFLVPWKERVKKLYAK